MNAKGIIIATIIGLILGFVGSTIVYNGRLGQLDSDLRASRENYRIIEQQYNALAASNIELGKRLDSIKSGVNQAKGIVGTISEQGQDIAIKLREVIAVLKKVKVILASIPSD